MDGRRHLWQDRDVAERGEVDEPRDGGDHVGELGADETLAADLDGGVGGDEPALDEAAVNFVADERVDDVLVLLLRLLIFGVGIVGHYYI